MPVYEYECREWGHRFDYLVLRTSPEAECLACQNKNFKLLISLCAVSSENTIQASLVGGRRKAAAARKEKRHEDHIHLHEHFEDHVEPGPGGKARHD